MNINFETLKTLQAELNEKFDSTETIAFAAISQTQLSLARHSAGCTINGHFFAYNPTGDSLIRADVIKWARKLLKERAKNTPKPETQTELFSA